MIIFKTPNGVIDSETRAMLMTLPFDATVRASVPCPYRPYRTDMNDQLRPRTDVGSCTKQRIDHPDQLRPRTDECR
jgi:hypothetical protein